jgi:hypothetical protein
MIYEAIAHRVEAKKWQIVDHHGAGYVTKTGLMVDAGRMSQDMFAGAGWTPAIFTDFEPEGEELEQILAGPGGRKLMTAAEHWGIFYWRNRYTVRADGSGPIERTEVNDLQAILTGVSRPGRH